MFCCERQEEECKAYIHPFFSACSGENECRVIGGNYGVISGSFNAFPKGSTLLCLILHPHLYPEPTSWTQNTTRTRAIQMHTHTHTHTHTQIPRQLPLMSFQRNLKHEFYVQCDEKTDWPQTPEWVQNACTCAPMSMRIPDRCTAVSPLSFWADVNNSMKCLSFNMKNVSR